MTNPPIRVVLDWDGVVFDDDHYKIALFDALKNASDLDQATIEQLYQSSKDANGYNDERLAQAVAKQTNLDASELLQAIHRSFDTDEGHYIYNDARSFISALAPTYPTSVLTAGTPRIQQQKITQSGLSALLESVVVVPAQHTEINKAEALQALYEKDATPIIFIDDRLSTIIHMHEVFRDNPYILPIWLNRSLEQHQVSRISWSTLSKEDFSKTQALVGVPKTLIAGVRLVKDETIFMVQENAGRAKGLWTIPIGHVDPDEPITAAAVRESYEESGLSTSLDSIHALFDVDGHRYLGADRDLDRVIILTCFNAQIDRTKSVDTPEFNSRWVSPQELADLPTRGDWQQRLVR